MIKVENLRKTFGNVVAVGNVSFDVSPGEIVGFLGPNGAGKTTTMRVLTGLVKPTEGVATVSGINVAEKPQLAQKKIGVLPDGSGLYPRLTARENITYFGQLHGIASEMIHQRLEELVDLLSMESIIDRKVRGFSHGEKTKVGLARAIIHDPECILLDEPTNGLDVLTTRAVRRLLKNLREQQKTIIFSSHLMHEVDHLCDRAVIIAGGVVVASGSLTELKAKVNATTFEDAFIEYAYGGKHHASE